MVNYLRGIISSILVFVMSIFGIAVPNVAEPTPLQAREYTDSELTVTADAQKYINVTVEDSGTEIFCPASYDGYRYGPTVFSNADGSIDAFFAAPGARGEWDWITYKHSPDGGKTWTNEKKVLGPTPGSDDAYSTCDPGVVRFGGYYYIGYTSTLDSRGTDNQIYVARSKSLDGQYEKWNGSGWGGKPKAFITYDDSPDAFGAGEPSFVAMGDELYIYYTWKGTGAQANQTRVAVADATDENWPATLEYKGVAIDYTLQAEGDSDSADVKYVEDYGKFIAVSTSMRFTEHSYVAVYESNDGISFVKSDVLKSNISYYCHNSGISSRPNGHIRCTDDTYIAYAHGAKLARWSTRLHKISISLAAAPDFSDALNGNARNDVVVAELPIIENYLSISDGDRVYSLKKGTVGVQLIMYKITDTNVLSRVLGYVRYYDYDKNVVKMVGNQVIPVGVGETYVTAQWNGMTTTFFVVVQP